MATRRRPIWQLMQVNKKQIWIVSLSYKCHFGDGFNWYENEKEGTVARKKQDKAIEGNKESSLMCAEHPLFSLCNCVINHKLLLLVLTASLLWTKIFLMMLKWFSDDVVRQPLSIQTSGYVAETKIVSSWLLWERWTSWWFYHQWQRWQINCVTWQILEE